MSSNRSVTPPKNKSQLDESKDKKIVTKFFQEEPPYKVIVSDETPFGAAAPEFKVIIKHSTINREFEAAEQKLKSSTDLSFKCHEDRNHIEISITPKIAGFSESDRNFRTLLSLPNKYYMTTKDLVGILQKYEDYLRQYNLESQYSSRQDKRSHYSRPGSNYSF